MFDAYLVEILAHILPCPLVASKLAPLVKSCRRTRQPCIVV